MGPRGRVVEVVSWWAGGAVEVYRVLRGGMMESWVEVEWIR